MPGHYPRFGTVDELVQLLADQASRTFVERREGAEPTPWAWLQELLLYEPQRQADVGEALSRLLTQGDACTYYALDQVYRAGPDVLPPIWRRLGTIGPKLADMDVEGSNEGALATLLRYLLTSSPRVPPLADDAVDFLLEMQEDEEEAWHLAVLIAAGARPDQHGATLADAVRKMSDSALSEVITTMMVKPDPFLRQPMDAIAALPDAPRHRFGRALKQITDQRDSDRAYLLSTTSDPARRQKFADAEVYDRQMGLDWPALEARLRL